MTVMHAMLGNAAVAAVLAVLALGIGRVCRSPAVRHLAWALVLLRLVTPPLLTVPLPVLPAFFHVPLGEPARAAAQWATAVWIAGAFAWFLWQGRRIVRSWRWVAQAEDAGPEVIEAVRCIAAALGVARPPAVKVVAGIGSPMLWGWGRRAAVLFPRELLARLAPEARDTLLAHELAHFLRRDHWMRVLEFVATGFYWWHPAVWFARAGIETAEEECCDAWVVGGLSASPRRYAEALLATVDFAAELRRPCLPPGGCAASRSVRLLHRRLAGIIHAEPPRRMRGAAAVRAAAVAVLLIQPVLQTTTPESTVQGQESASRSATAAPRSGSRPIRLVRPLARESAEPAAWATALSPNGQLTALARDNEVVLRQADGSVKPLGPGKPLALAFAPGGKRLATSGPGPLVRTWDYHGSLLETASLPAMALSIAYSPDGSRLVVLDAAGGIAVRHPDTLAPLAGWSVEGPANTIACAPDNNTVAVACGSWLGDVGWVECWSIPEQRRIARYEAGGPVGAVRFVPDGGLLVIGGWSGLCTWRTLPGGEVVAKRQLSKDVVAAASFSPDSGTLPFVPPPQPTAEPPGGPNLLDRVGQLPRR